MWKDTVRNNLIEYIHYDASLKGTFLGQHSLYYPIPSLRVEFRRRGDFCFNGFIRVALVTKIILVSVVQFYSTSLYIVLCVHHSKSSLLPSPFIPPLPFSTSPHSPFPRNHHTVCVYKFRGELLNPFTFFTQPPTFLPTDSCQSILCIHKSVSILFVDFVQ